MHVAVDDDGLAAAGRRAASSPGEARRGDAGVGPRAADELGRRACRSRVQAGEARQVRRDRQAVERRQRRAEPAHRLELLRPAHRVDPPPLDRLDDQHAVVLGGRRARPGRAAPNGSGRGRRRRRVRPVRGVELVRVGEHLRVGDRPAEQLVEARGRRRLLGRVRGEDGAARSAARGGRRPCRSPAAARAASRSCGRSGTSRRRRRSSGSWATPRSGPPFSRVSASAHS